MTIQLRLNTHLQERLANRSWLADCLKGTPAAFPYTPNCAGKATIGKVFAPENTSTNQVSPNREDTHPQFVLGIPMAKRPDGSSDYSFLQSRVQLLRDEAFGEIPSDSHAQVAKSIAAVVGINQIHSIDPAINKSFERFIRNVPLIEGIAYRVIGFFWHPAWVQIEKKRNIYPLAKAFLLLKALSPEHAALVRRATEFLNALHLSIGEQIPFQQIREVIKNATATNSFIQQALTRAPLAPIYYTIMDADFVGLRTGVGLFSHIAARVSANSLPSVICPGYQTNSDHAFIRFAVKVDMAVRAAMSSVIPYAAYCPEPCTAFLVRSPLTGPYLVPLSFLGAGRTLESRRFIENGRTRKLLGRTMVFLAHGGVTTTIPQRMLTDKNQSFRAFRPEQVKEKAFLQALRGLPQTHATPKQWADNLYCALDFSCPRVTDATTPMMYIFGVFDPISRMYSQGRHSAHVFDTVLSDYGKPLSDAQQEVLKTARLRLLALTMKQEMIDAIEQAARKSGLAIYNMLHEASHPATTGIISTR